MVIYHTVGGVVNWAEAQPMPSQLRARRASESPPAGIRLSDDEVISLEEAVERFKAILRGDDWRLRNRLLQAWSDPRQPLEHWEELVLRAVIPDIIQVLRQTEPISFFPKKGLLFEISKSFRENFENAQSVLAYGANALAQIGPDVLDMLIQELAGPSIGARQAAARAIGMIKYFHREANVDAAIQPLIHALKDADPMVGVYAASALREVLGKSRAADLLAGLVIRDPNDASTYCRAVWRNRNVWYYPDDDFRKNNNLWGVFLEALGTRGVTLDVVESGEDRMPEFRIVVSSEADGAGGQTERSPLEVNAGFVMLSRAL